MGSDRWPSVVQCIYTDGPTVDDWGSTHARSQFATWPMAIDGPEVAIDGNEVSKAGLARERPGYLKSYASVD